MKSTIGLSLMLASLFMNGNNRLTKINNEYLPKETEEEKRKRKKIINKKINEGNGLKEFFYYGNSVLAINQKVADKKAKRLNYI